MKKSSNAGKFLFITACFLCLAGTGSILTVPAMAGRNVTLQWQPNTEPDLAGYRLYQTESPGEYDLDSPAAEIPAGTETVTLFDLETGPHCWVLTAFDLADNESEPSNEVCLDLPQGEEIYLDDLWEAGFYGNYPDGDPAYSESITYTFDGSPGNFVLEYRLWDIDYEGEVEILLNGESLGPARVTGQGRASPVLTTLLPDALIEDGAENTLTFRCATSPPESMWAVGTVAITRVLPLPARDFYGNLADVPGGDRSHPGLVAFEFDGDTNPFLLSYRAYDVDGPGEIKILLNGRPLGEVTSVADGEYTPPQFLFLPSDQIHEGTNTIVFDNVLNPPYLCTWGVGEVETAP